MSDERHGVFRPLETYAFLEDGGRAPRIDVTTAFWSDLMSGAPQSESAKLVAGGNGWLAALYSIAESSRSWEMHPAGDELLLMVSGAMTVVLESGDREEPFDLHVGEALIVPRGTWHCQRVLEPGQFFGVTYGKGTEHRSI